MQVVVSDVFTPAPVHIPYKKIAVSVAAAAFIATAITGVPLAKQYIAPNSIANPVIQSANAQAAAVAATPSAQTPASKPAPAATAIQACSPISAPGAATTASGRSPGLYTSVDAPKYYPVYGTTADQIRNQILKCGPLLSDGRRYAGVTSYNTSWSFSHTPIPGNPSMCKITNPIVVMRVTQALPTWQASAGTKSNVTSAWQSFISGLTTHENGHAQLNVTTARSIYSQLQNYPAMSCLEIHNSATGMVKAELARLNALNSNYDNDTHHGETQGSLL